MKKSLLTLILIATLKLGAFAQGYTFTQSLAPYTDLVAPTLITTNSIWDDTSVVVPIGFPFTFGTNTFSNVEITSNGVLSLPKNDGHLRGFRAAGRALG